MDNRLSRFAGAAGRVITCAAAVLLLETGLAYSQTPQTVQTIWPEVPFDFNSGVLNRQLPFDVPFVVTGAIRPETTQVQAYLWQIPRRRADGTRIPDSELVCPATTEKWIPIQPWKRVANIAPDTQATFALLFPKLEVNEIYCFRFAFERKPAKEELDAATPITLRSVDSVLRRVAVRQEIDPLAEISDSEAIEIRDGIIRAIETASGLVVSAPPKTLWDRQAPLATVRSELIRELQPALTLQANGASQRRNFNAGLDDAIDALRIVALDMRFQSLAQSPALRADRAADVRALLELRNGNVAAITRATALPLGREDNWAPNATQARTTEIGATVERLERVVAELNAAPAAVLKQLKLEPGQVSELVKQVESAIGELRSASTAAGQLEDTIDARNAAVTGIAQQLTLRASDEIVLLGSTSAQFATRNSWYISADIGLAYSVGIGEVFPYIGTNIYFRPVNKEAPLSSFQGWQRWSRSLSAMVGITYGNDPSDPSTTDPRNSQRKPLFNGRLLVAGGGFRATDSLRLASGVLLFKATDPNPLVNRERIDTDWFLSISFDWDVRGTFRDLGTVFGFNRP